MAKKEIESGINYKIYSVLSRKGFFQRDYENTHGIDFIKHVLKVTDDMDDQLDYVFLTCQRNLRLNGTKHSIFNRFDFPFRRIDKINTPFLTFLKHGIRGRNNETN